MIGFRAYNKTYLYDYSEVFTPLAKCIHPLHHSDPRLGCEHSATRERWLSTCSFQPYHWQILEPPLPFLHKIVTIFKFPAVLRPFAANESKIQTKRVQKMHKDEEIPRPQKDQAETGSGGKFSQKTKI